MKASTADIDRQLRSLLEEALGLASDRVGSLTPESPLFGAWPELDSLAAANLLAELEARFGFRIDPEDLDQPILETFGKLSKYISDKKSFL
jgi:acyl carrier protein